jgi:hypothetical protein
MRNLPVLFIIIIFFLSSCSSIKIVKDPFKNSTVVTMDMDHYASISGLTRFANARGGQYSREIKDGKKLPISVSFRLHTSTNVTELSNEAYVKVDDKVIKLVLTDINTGSRVSLQNTTNLNIYTGKMQQGYTASSFNVLSGKVILANEIEESILKAKSIQYRLYSQADPIDIIVSGDQIKKIKEFALITGEDKK